jgi:hypothetical protein
VQDNGQLLYGHLEPDPLYDDLRRDIKRRAEVGPLQARGQSVSRLSHLLIELEYVTVGARPRLGRHVFHLQPYRDESKLGQYV